MIGVDIELLSRFEGKVDDKFLNKVCDEREIEYIMQKGNKEQTLAGIYCAKEAISKVFKCGIFNELSLKDIVILHEKNGAPYLLENEKIIALLKKFELKKIHVSISHDNLSAIAVALGEK